MGLAITFLWIGVLVFQDPASWGSYIQPWAVQLLPATVFSTMIGVAILDVLVGLFLLFDVLTWVAAFVGAVHILLVLVASGITDITIRDVGLLTGSLALCFEGLPHWVLVSFGKKSDVV